MSFNKGIPVQVTGASYQSRSKPLSVQQTVNFYQQANEQGKDTFVLMPFPGLKTLGNETGLDRGLTRMSEICYQVKGEILYEIDRLGNHIDRGVIPGTQRCIFGNDGVNLFIVVPNDRVWQYSADSNSLAEVTDQAISGSLSVDFFNNQFIYTKPQLSTVSKVGNGAESSGSINEETLPDDLVRDFVFDEVIYRSGTRSIVGWYNSGVGDPPIDKLQGRIFNVGVDSVYSMAKTDEAFYWLGDDKAIYRARAGVKERISTDAISDFLELNVTNDAIANTFTFQGQNFYQITFPTANKTFVYNEGLGQLGWFELSSGINGGKYQATSILQCYGKILCADETNGNIYELDRKVFTNNSETIKRVRVTGAINGDLLGAKGRRIQMSKAKFIMSTGNGLISGQGENPRILVEYSDDGGRTWEHGEWPEIGRLGENTLQVEWCNLESFYERFVRISVTDPVEIDIYSATIDLRLAGI